MAAYTAIDDPSAHFKVQLYTGNGAANHAITFDDTDTDMQPDLVWIKNRDATDSHCVFDAVRGATKVIHMDTTAADATDADTLDSFTSDGFQVDADVKVNTNTEKYVSWNWKANGTGSSNTDGSINTAATSANTTAGFSINTYTGTGSNATVGHGLGVKPAFIAIKNIASTQDWLCYSEAITANKHIKFNQTEAAGTDATGRFNGTEPTTAVFTVGTDSQTNGSEAMIAYAFTSVTGFSQFGAYEGNGKIDGTFVYTGFRPALIMTKAVDSTSAWHMYDDQREGFNPDNDALITNDTTVEATTDMIDILSNGFKFRIATDPNVAETHIYLAWAKAPFVNSNGVPCNAR